MADSKPALNRFFDRLVGAIMLVIGLLVALAVATVVVRIYTVFAVLLLIIAGLIIYIMRLRRQHNDHS